MPCIVEDYPEKNDRISRELSELTDAFCSACTALEEAGVPVPPAARALWAEHRREDAARIAQEKADKQRARLRANALKRLTPDERDALGLRGE